MYLKLKFLGFYNVQRISAYFQETIVQIHSVNNTIISK